MDYVIGILLIVAAIFLIVAVLLQSDKDKSLSGAIAGGSAETFYGKNKGKGVDSMLPKITTVVAIVFAVLVLISFVIQDDTDLNDIYDELTATDAVTTEDTTTDKGTESESGSETTAETADSTSADSTSAA
jgi:preprotein translocase subunit SecG